MFFSPLESFETFFYFPLNFIIIDLSITSFSVCILCVFLLLYLSFFFKFALIFSFFKQFFFESSFLFFLRIFKEQVSSKKALKFFPIFYVFFYFVLFCNILGLAFFSFTLTAQVFVPFFFSFFFNLAFLFLGFLNFGFYFLKLFVPQGVPLVLIPLLVIIEIISYFIRPFSLALRLFANMMAGHTLLHIIGFFCLNFIDNFCWDFYYFKIHLGILFFFFPLFFIFIVFFLEVAISFIQAYVFFILSAIYLNDSFNLH